MVKDLRVQNDLLYLLAIVKKQKYETFLTNINEPQKKKAKETLSRFTTTVVFEPSF